jgi:hypothetical protein
MGRGLEMESQMRKPLKRQSVFRAQTLPSEAIRTIEKLKSSKTEIPAKAREDGCMAIQEDMAQQPIVIPGLPPVQQAAWGFWLSQTIYVAAKLGVLLDRAPIIAGAREQIESAGMSERCELVIGDFFDEVPSGGDAYMMSFILHGWDDERALAILKNCHRAMPGHAKLLAVEMVVPPGNEPGLGKFADLNVMVISVGARERTEAEYRDLLSRGGFKLIRVIPTSGLQSVLEAVRV